METLNYNILPVELQRIIIGYMSIGDIKLTYKYVSDDGVREDMKVKVWKEKGIECLMKEGDYEGVEFMEKECSHFPRTLLWDTILYKSIDDRDLESFKRVYVIYCRNRTEGSDDCFTEMIDELLPENPDIFKFLFEASEECLIEPMSIAISNEDLETAKWVYEREKYNTLDIKHLHMTVASNNRELAEWVISKGLDPLDYIFNRKILDVLENLYFESRRR